MVKFLEIAIGIAIEIEIKCNKKTFDPDFDSDFDPEKEISETIKALVNDIGPGLVNRVHLSRREPPWGHAFV
jgi:hypothetical protein